MQRYESAQKEMADRMLNLLLENLRLSQHKSIFVDSMSDGRSVVTKLIDDHPLTELTRLEGTRLTTCRLSQQRRIALKVMRKRWFYGASLYISYLCREWLLQSIQTFIRLWK